MTAIPTTYLAPKQTQKVLPAAATTTKMVDNPDTFQPTSSTSQSDRLKSYRSLPAGGAKTPGLAVQALTVVGAGAAVALASALGGPMAGLATLAAVGGLSYQQGQIRHLQAENEELRVKASTDALTRVLNRGAILESLDQAVKHSQANGQPVGVVMVDIDHFKKVNDTYGHPAGDSVLREVAQRLSQGLRQGDLLGRYGGEEMLIILPNCQPPELQQVCERLRHGLEMRSMHSASAEVPVTASFGATYLADTINDSAESLLDRADAGLYQAKDSGRNCVKVA